MAIEPSKFIFNSDLLYEQRTKKFEVDVVTSGNVASAVSQVWSSEWFSMAEPGSTIRAEVYMPGDSYQPNVSNGKYRVPSQIIYDNSTFIMAYPRIELTPTQFRCCIVVFNNTGSTVASPNRTFSFTVKEFLPPTNV